MIDLKIAMPMGLRVNRQPGIEESPQQAPEFRESGQTVALVSVRLVAQTCFL